MGLPIIPNRFSAHFQPVRPSLPNGSSPIHMHSEQHEKRPESASKPPSCGFKKRLFHSFQTISKGKTSNLRVSATFFPETTHSTYTAIATHSPTDRKSPPKRSKSTKSAVSSKKHRSRRAQEKPMGTASCLKKTCMRRNRQANTPHDSPDSRPPFRPTGIICHTTLPPHGTFSVKWCNALHQPSQRSA